MTKVRGGILFLFITFLSAEGFPSSGMARQAVRSISLDGLWQVALQDEMPEKYTSVCPVPGIASQADPPLRADLHHNSSEVDYGCIWYRKTFRLPKHAKHGAVLHLRAKYNAEVFLNGKEVGFSDCCTYSHACFDISDALNHNGENELIVKVGSWLNASFPSKENSSEWWRTSRCPGIWDSVYIEFYDAVYVPVLEILPDVAGNKLTCRTSLENKSSRRKKISPKLVFRDSSRKKVLHCKGDRFILGPGEKKDVTYTITNPGFHPWIPGPQGSPDLYTAEYSSRGRLLRSARFGFRDITIEGTSVLLNGEKTHFCSENIAFQRTLISWANATMNPDWVRKFLRAVIHDYGFNHLRMHLGHAPSFWYDIADEEGIMLQDEWCFMHEKDPEGDNLAQTETEFRMWVKENINHPSIVAWDMENEGDVELKALCEELKAYDPTRPWAEDDFDTQHRYEYSENIVPRPYCEPDGMRPTTVLESCRLWINPKGELEPRENFKTSRTATSWGVYYYDRQKLEELQSAIHADLGTYFRSLGVQAWAPFALLSGTVNGHDYFRGDIRDSLVPNRNLQVLSKLNSPVGASLLMLQAREQYKERLYYTPDSDFSKPVVLWNDSGKDIPVKAKTSLLGVSGKVVSEEKFSTTVPAFGAVTLDKAFSIVLPSTSGEYDVLVSLEWDDGSFLSFPRRIFCGVAPQDLSNPFGGAISVLDHFLPDMSELQKRAIIKATYGNPIDSIRRKDTKLLIYYTVYDKNSSRSFEMTIDTRGAIINNHQILATDSGWLKHAF